MINNFDVLNSDVLIIGHMVSAIVVSVISVFVLNNRYPNQKIRIFSLFFIFSLSLPMLGPIFGLWLVYYFWKHQYDHDILDIHKVNKAAAFLNFPLIKRQFGDGAVHEVLYNNDMPVPKRLSILTLLSENKSKTNLAMIKNMLSSQNDELRLLSFAAIDRLEQDIHKEIHKNYDKLSLCDPDNKYKYGKITKKLAFSYWELVYFELADVALKSYLLEKVEKYCRDALKNLPNDASLYELLGKMYFEKQDDIKSEQYFSLALKYTDTKNEANLAYLTPYLAEINYNKRDFIKLKELLSNVEVFNQIPKLRPIKEVWS